ncbi:MAG: type IV pilus biogenesis protein PilM [Victivallales bacterium]|jgi:hypothetical protein|nr:type IV pilus biogenesis protein PilM [Victivallales bacterium]
MKALAVAMLLLGICALVRPFWDEEYEDGAAHSIAVNYAIYRNEVFHYVYRHKGVTGTIQLSSLAMPATWHGLRAWRARVEDGRCYVYGEATQEEIAAVRDLFRGSFALGMASKGTLIPVLGSAIPVPGFIPDGSLVSITEVE